MPKVTQIVLPSFLRRILKAYALKAEIRAQGCELQRIGRSRNWLLKATNEQLIAIIDIIETANEDSWLWLGKLLRTHQESFSHQQLLAIAQKRPTITVTELMHVTNCTLAQARRVLDELEWQEN
ncbi:ribosome recycling factor family protein [Thalassotalea ganghwensis]